MKHKEIVEELNTLPKGYISKKKIRNKTYNYLQYLEDGVLKSDYVSEAKLNEIYDGLLKRKQLEELVSKEINNVKKLPIISKNCLQLTGDLMMKDEIVASFDNGEITYLNNEKCPLYIKRTRNIKGYLASRVIDSSRTNSRILKRVMEIKEKEDYIISLYAHGAIITDNYWFKPKQSKLKYKDIEFKDDSYADVALDGVIYFFPKSPRYSPQLTLGGSFEKCWKRINNKWYLYKKGSKEEIFSELFCSRLARVLNISTATYEYEDGYIKTENFAKNVNFEPIAAIAGEDDSYQNVFDSLNEYGKDIQKQYLKLIWFDSLVNNVDRHNENCGLLKDQKNGKVISFAPNFDNNMALIAKSKTLNLNVENDGFIKILTKFLNNKEVKELYKQIDIPNITANDLKEIFASIEIKEDEKLISEYILRRYKYLKKIIKDC